MWGRDPSEKRPNGLYDKIVKFAKSGKPVVITSFLTTAISVIHIDDLVDLLMKAITQTKIRRGMWVVGNFSISIGELIQQFPVVTFSTKPKGENNKLFIDASRVRKDFGWTPNRTLA